MKFLMNGKLVEFPDEQREEYIPTAEERISILKNELAESDYKAIKYAEGWYSEEEYAPIRAKRQALRNRINELEAEA